MTSEIEVRATIHLNAGVGLTFETPVEISLDCPRCLRTDRTVSFAEVDRPGRCTPTGHAFPGAVGPLRLTFAGGDAELATRLRYDYEPFVDCKYATRIPDPVPTWGRLHFRTTCPRCGAAAGHSLQNNTVLPCTGWCPCGYELYVERERYPSFVPVPPS